MANLPISSLQLATLPLSGTEAVPVVQGGTTTQCPASAFGAVALSPVSYATFVGALADVAPLAADTMAYVHAGTSQKCTMTELNALIMGIGIPGNLPDNVGSLGWAGAFLGGQAGSVAWNWPSYANGITLTDGFSSLFYASGEHLADVLGNLYNANIVIAAGGKLLYTPATPANWAGSPTNLADAIDRIAAVVSVGGAMPIP